MLSWFPSVCRIESNIPISEKISLKWELSGGITLAFLFLYTQLVVCKKIFFSQGMQSFGFEQPEGEFQSAFSSESAFFSFGGSQQPSGMVS